MTTRPLVDPELAAMLDQVPTVELTEEIVKQVRAMDQTQKLPNLPMFPDIEVTECFVPGLEGVPEVRVLLYLPITVEGPRPTLLWIHGGGYIMGSPEQEDLMVKNMVSAIGCVAVSGYCILV
jgi:acetyl esterase/lipase